MSVSSSPTIVRHGRPPDPPDAVRVSSRRSWIGELWPAVLLLLAAAPVTFVVRAVNDRLQDQPERAVQVLAALFGVLLLLPPSVYLLRRRRCADPATIALIGIATMSVLLLAVYLYWVSFYVAFPADILIWSESDFVNDILKFRIGYPLYTPQVNNESYEYTPGAQLITYYISQLLGNPDSVPMYRSIQLGFTALAAAGAAVASRILLALAAPRSSRRYSGLWTGAGAIILVLIATNALTNPFVHNLHNDALAQLISIVAYLLLLVYIARRDRWALAAMAVVPAAGFLVKQNLAIWAVLYILYLVVFDRPRSAARLGVFALGAFGGLGLAVGASYLLWGDSFVYWVLVVLRANPTSPLRAFQHLLDAWAYMAIGLVAAAVLLRRRSSPQLFGAWLVWLGLFLIEAYTSGLGWTRSHLGPASLIAGLWFVAALIRLWPLVLRNVPGTFRPDVWLRAAVATSLVGLLFSGLGIIRIPLPPELDDAYRYERQIEDEFAAQSAANILLDAGTWIYFDQGVVMKDRAASFGDRGWSGIGDFSGIIRRVDDKQYAKILVRNLHSPDLWYDHWMWPRSSGIRQALLDNYEEVRTIPGVSSRDQMAQPSYLFSTISVLVPKSN